MRQMMLTTAMTLVAAAVTGPLVECTSLPAAGIAAVLIAVVPAEVRRIGGVQGFARNYGRVFTAWGIAGITGPVTAGFLYDMTLGYGAALAMAAVLSLCSCFTILRAGK